MLIMNSENSFCNFCRLDPLKKLVLSDCKVKFMKKAHFYLSEGFNFIFNTNSKSIFGFNF